MFNDDKGHRDSREFQNFEASVILRHTLLGMKMTNESLEKRLGLHQSIEVYYVVSGYVAALVNEEGYRPLTIAKGAEGKTVLDSIVNLAEALRCAT